MRIILLLFFFSFLQAYPQTEIDNSLIRYPFNHLGVEDGISPGSVNCFLKEDNGFLWIGTSSGLNRYDGYNITSFNPDPLNPDAIQSRNCRQLFQDPLGNIWVETVIGINIFDKAEQSFSSNQSRFLEELNLPNIQVESIIRDNKGNFLFLHEDSTVSYWAEGGTVTRPENFNTKASKQGIKISSIHHAGKGNFWLIYENGLIQKLDGQSFKVIEEIVQLRDEFSGTTHDFQIIADCMGNLWIYLYEDFGIYYFDVEEQNLEHYTTETSDIRLSSNLVSALSIDSNGSIWVGSDHGGIMVIDPSNFSHYYLQNSEEIPNSLSNNSITSIYSDNDGIVWVGTFKNGIDYYHPDIIRFNLQQNLISDPESLPFNDINVFAEDDDGNLYLGTNGGGLIVRDNESGKYKQFLNDPEDPNSLSSNIIVSLLFDSNGNLWIGTYLGGLNKMVGEKFTVFKNDPEDPRSIAGDNIWELYEDSRGIIWVGTLTNGLNYFYKDRESFYHMPSEDFNNSINNTYITSITEDGAGNIWVGGDSGIDVFNPGSNYQEHFIHDPKDSSSLSNNNILSIHVDSNDRVWIGNRESLDLFSSENNGFYHYDESDGLPGETIIGIVEDDQMDLWLTTPYGIVQFKKAAKGEGSGKIPPNFTNYSKIDGLQGNLFNENSIFKNQNGEIVVGGLHGYNIFNPKNFEYNKKPPKVIFTGFSLFNEEVKTDEKIDGRILLDKPIHKTSEITLNYDENIFSVEFAALDFFQPSKNRYRYKLEGFEKNWQEVGSQQRKVTYTNLDPGEYTFKVLASNNDLVWSEVPQNLGIVIKPPFYKTYYAYLIYILLLIGLLYLARRRIILKQRKSFLIEQEKREAAHLHKMDLMKIRFFTNISHEFKSPLSLIISPAEKLKEKHLSKDASDQVNLISRNAQKLLNLINQILDLGNIRNDKLLQTSKGNVIKFIKEIAENFKSYSENKGIHLKFRSSTEKFNTVFDKDKLDKIIYNLLSNALKFTPKGGEVLLKLEMEEQEKTSEGFKGLKIIVEDSGIGISQENKEHIFDRFFKVDHPEGNSSGSGIGLSIVQEYVNLYKGDISVESELGKGTRFEIRIPLQDLDDEKGNVEIKEEDSSKMNKELENLLIIDDSRDFLNFLTKEFTEYYNVFIASDAETGWKKALSVRPDLIICDQMMPGMLGTELCAKIRKDSRTKHIPFILLTAKSDEEDIAAAFKIGVNDFVKKPFNFNTLYSRVQNLISQRKSFQKVYSKKIEVPDFISHAEIEGGDEKLVKKLLHLIRENIGNSNFSVEKLATQLNVSRSYLYSKSMSLFEKSPQELIIESRLEKGTELLKKSQLTISEIAFQTGFNNPKNFTRNFKKKYKQLPSTYRQKFHSTL